MTIRRWIGSLAFVAALLPVAVLAQDTAAKSKTAAKTHKAGDKTKAAKAGGKGAEKSKGSATGADDSVTDTWITTKIKTDVSNDSTLKNSDITIDTKSNVVTLKGTVASEAAKARAEQIAKGTQGVTKVVDNLTIKLK